MKTNGRKPNTMTYQNLALDCFKAKLVEEAMKTLDLGMDQTRTTRVGKSTLWLENTLSIVDIFAEKGDVENAEKLFEELAVYNILIKAYVKAKIYDSNLLGRMILGGARPDAGTYSLIKLAEQFRT
ncbi:hypothetical protein L1049_014226 [Liquidambar formosana]|uniref:Pentatricopeptide repeat-containing protein n=1 Tax=Liquidambar formosana TaxID=63359 RepID=A0AAP0RQL0_LIQFO